jgi:hypothetical protein
MSDIYDEYREAPQGCGGTMIGIAGIIIIIVLLLVGCKTQYIAGQDTERIVEVHHHDYQTSGRWDAMVSLSRDVTEYHCHNSAGAFVITIDPRQIAI